jgi:hypothetical protein
VEYVKLEDRVHVQRAPVTLDIDPILGTWVNTNPSSRGIVRLHLSSTDGGLTIRPFAAGGAVPGDWGEIPADAVYGDRLEAGTAVAFTAGRDFGFMRSQLQANVSLGLLIVAAFHVFTDGSQRSNFYAREFYRRT